MHCDLIAEKLFRKYYSFTGEKVTAQDVKNCRNHRFAGDNYWKIWKEYGEFFGFIEGFFHVMDGTNQLYKIPEKERQIFQSSGNLLKNFQNCAQLLEYFLENGIKRLASIHANRIFLASSRIENDFHGCVPKDFETLLTFDGYGRKIANMVMNFVFDIPRIAIDVRVFRSAVNLELVPASFADMGKFPKYRLLAEEILHQKFAKSIFLIEMDYLLFSHGEG